MKRYVLYTLFWSASMEKFEYINFCPVLTIKKPETYLLNFMLVEYVFISKKIAAKTLPNLYKLHPKP